MKLSLKLRFFFLAQIYAPFVKFLGNIRWKRKIKKLIRTKSTKSLTKTQLDAIKKNYKSKGINDVSTLWHQFYASNNGFFSVSYIPENLFYMDIEPKLNKKSYVGVLADKNLLGKLFPDMKQPETIVKNVNGFFYSKEQLIHPKEVERCCNSMGELFIKPTLDTGGGKNVAKFTSTAGKTDNNGLPLEELLLMYKKDFIIQKKVRQHSQMSKLNPTSLNTFRVMSYLQENKVLILSVIVRMGLKGSITDNSTTGGLSCGVNTEGQLNEVGYQLSGKNFTETDMETPFKEIQLPFMDKINAAVEILHSNAPYFKIISWDLAIDENGEVVFIEYNIKGQDITFHQLNNGAVLAPVLEDYQKIKIS